MDIGKVTFGPAERAVAGRGTRAVSTDTALQARIEALERALRGLCQACEDSGYYHLLEHSDIGHWWESQKRATR